MVNILDRTEFFKNWLDGLTDKPTKKRIETRIKRAEDGNFGDMKSVGEGVFEMRLHFGTGYRLYYFQRGMQFYWLLIGGDKDTQALDVERAKVMKHEIERSKS
jgi:putative addiction module killer protein